MSAAEPLGAATRGRRAWFARLLSLPLFLGLWQLVSEAGFVNAALFPPPTQVAVAFYDYVVHGTFWEDLGMSLSRVAIGYAGGAAAGIAIGVLTGGSRFWAALLGPLFQLLRPIPPIAFVPIVIVWFGLTELGKWFLVFWGVFFAVWVATHLGIQRVNPTLVRAARCLGAGDRRVLFEIMLPATLPVIFVGLRSSVSISFYTLVAAELAGAFAGIAYRLEITQQNMQIAHMMAGLITLGLISATADRLFGLAQRLLIRWE